MFALGIRYLQGIAVGSHGEHGHVEWPPHPARVFMAMVAAHYQTGADAAERAALCWLEELPEPPEIHAPDAEPCKVVTQFVPVNDKAGPSKSADALFAGHARSAASHIRPRISGERHRGASLAERRADAGSARGPGGVVWEGHACRALDFTRADVARGCGSRQASTMGGG